MMRRALKFIEEMGGSFVDRAVTRAGHIVLKCANGHEWRARISNVANGHWCPQCYGNAPLSIEAMRDLAEKRGGKCKSEVYVNSKTHLLWECGYGHEWEATPNNVKTRGSWCPHCRFNVGEELARAALLEAFPDKTFDRTRREPWMGGLELDGFNEELRLAFEYQGKQHYEQVDHFHRKDGEFAAQQERDLETVVRCEGAFMTLLVVPYTVDFASIRGYVRKELLDLAYEIAPAIDSDADFYDRVRAASPASSKQFERAVAVITRKGGVCLSEQYVGYRVPLQIRCAAGHIFEASLEAIDQPASRGPRFCPMCGGTRKKEDDVLRASVESCGYSFLSIESREVSGRKRRYLRVRCPRSHEYEVLWDNFKPTDGTPRKGCAKCFHANLGKSKRNEIGAWCEAHGVWPTAEYQGLAKPCTWRCAVGHEFAATKAALNHRAKACMECWLSEFAEEHSLRLLTDWGPRSGATTPLQWECSRCGGVFVASVIGLGRKTRYCLACD